MDINLPQQARAEKRIRLSWRPILIILASALVLGALAFSIALSRDSNLRVFGMVEVARVYTVDVNGTISSDFVIDPALIVRTVNAREQQQSRSDGSEVSGQAHLVARLARGGSLVELEAISDSLSVAESKISETLDVIRKQAEPARLNALARLNAQNSEALKEIRRLGEWREKLDAARTPPGRGGVGLSDSLSMVVMGMMRADTERQLHDVERQWRAYLTALQLMEERATRLGGPVFVETSFPSASIGAGLVGFFVGALAASAVFFVRRQPLVSIA